MTSPARRHFQQAQAAKAAGATAAHEPQKGDAHDLMHMALVEDRRRLHDIQSIERKIEVKAELLPNYQPYIDGVLEAGQGAQDDVLMTLMIWHLDVGDIERGLTIAAYALQHGLETPDQHKRTTATLVAEEIADYYLRLNDDAYPENALALLEHTEALTRDHDMHDQVRAKLFKALGQYQRDSDPDTALSSLKRALDLNDKVGVKKDIERLERELKNTAAGNTPAT